MQAKALAKEVADLLRSTIRLNVKMNGISASDDQLEPEELEALAPRDLSYWIASFFADVKYLQQAVRPAGQQGLACGQQEHVCSCVRVGRGGGREAMA